jgi:hypothetical protein
MNFHYFRVIEDSAGVKKSGLDVFFGKLRIAFEDIVPGIPSRYLIQNDRHRNASSLDHRFSVTNPGIKLDTVKRSHGKYLQVDGNALKKD